MEESSGFVGGSIRFVVLPRTGKRDVYAVLVLYVARKWQEIENVRMSARSPHSPAV
jgi:hypothetical protein